MSAITTTPKAVLKMPSKWGDRVLRVQDIEGKLTNNTYFPTGWTTGTLTQAQFNADFTAFINAEAAINSGLPGAVGLRNAAFTKLHDDLDNVMGMVQIKAKANPTIAETIIESAGFFVRATTSGQKKQNAVFNIQIVGTIIITADGGGHHDWEMSKDMVTITKLPSTDTAKTTVTGLTPGDVWYVRSKKVDTKKHTYNWSPWLLIKIGPGGKSIGGGNSLNSAGNLAAQ